MTDTAIGVAQGVSGIPDVDTVAINTIRGLCMEKRSRRPTPAIPARRSASRPSPTPSGSGTCASTRPSPSWPNHDRFVLSEGHASALLWSLLHLTRVRAVDPDYEVLGRAAIEVSMEDLQTFRRLGLTLPGHRGPAGTARSKTTTKPHSAKAWRRRWAWPSPASGWSPGTTGKGFSLFDFDVYALAGDGCMMEGISREAASFAGHQRLSNLCWIYDSNRVTTEGHTDITFTEDVAARFIAYGWNVAEVADVNDVKQVARAFQSVKAERERPRLIVVHSHIGYGSPVEDSPKVHGEPLSVSRGSGPPSGSSGSPGPRFLRPDRSTLFRLGRGRGGKDRGLGSAAHGLPSLQPSWPRRSSASSGGSCRTGWDGRAAHLPADPKGLASHDSSGQVLNPVAQAVPWLLGGSADLAPSTKTRLTFDGAGNVQPADRAGRNLHFGIREHAAAAIANGMALTKVRPYWSGFLIFSDYGRAANRLSALMEMPVMHVFTHDWIGVGEAAPRISPSSSSASLRAMPGLLVFRPADANEVVETWRIMGRAAARAGGHRPVPPGAAHARPLGGTAPAAGVARGAYVLIEAEANGAGVDPEVILLATGSEVSLALKARDKLQAGGIATRVVSMPCWELFDRQPQPYRDEVLPPRCGPGSGSSRPRRWDGTATSATRARSSACTPSGHPRR